MLSVLPRSSVMKMMPFISSMTAFMLKTISINFLKRFNLNNIERVAAAPAVNEPPAETGAAIAENNAVTLISPANQTISL